MTIGNFRIRTVATSSCKPINNYRDFFIKPIKDIFESRLTLDLNLHSERFRDILYIFIGSICIRRDWSQIRYFSFL